MSSAATASGSVPSDRPGHNRKGVQTIATNVCLDYLGVGVFCLD